MSTPVIEEEQAALPAIFEHCQRVYERMEAEAKLVTTTTDMGREEELNVLIWEGYLTKTFAALHLSVPHYTSVTRELKRMGCIRQKRRGGGNAPSQWQIITAPTEELFRSDTNRTSGISARRPSRTEMLEQQIRSLAQRVGKVEADNESILDILMEKEDKS